MGMGWIIALAVVAVIVLGCWYASRQSKWVPTGEYELSELAQFLMSGYSLRSEWALVELLRRDAIGHILSALISSPHQAALDYEKLRFIVKTYAKVASLDPIQSFVKGMRDYHGRRWAEGFITLICAQAPPAELLRFLKSSDWHKNLSWPFSFIQEVSAQLFSDKSSEHRHAIAQYLMVLSVSMPDNVAEAKAILDYAPEDFLRWILDQHEGNPRVQRAAAHILFPKPSRSLDELMRWFSDDRFAPSVRHLLARNIDDLLGSRQTWELYQLLDDAKQSQRVHRAVERALNKQSQRGTATSRPYQDILA